MALQLNNYNPIYNRSEYDEYVYAGIYVMKFGWIDTAYYMNMSDVEMEPCGGETFLNSTKYNDARKIKDNFLCAKNLSLNLQGSFSSK